MIHIYMEMSQQNSLYSYCKQTKMSFLKKMENRKVNSSCLVVGTSGRGEDIRKRCRRVNVVEILCVHV
jgi:hypothetical protein